MKKDIDDCPDCGGNINNCGCYLDSEIEDVKQGWHHGLEVHGSNSDVARNQEKWAKNRA